MAQNINPQKAIHHVFVVCCQQSEGAHWRKKDIVKGRESILFPVVSMYCNGVCKLVPKA